ncbi:MAG: GTPase HflX [Legionellales bacterium]|nr:GTPase HflX [Legionellales bacterium]
MPNVVPQSERVLLIHIQFAKGFEQQHDLQEFQALVSSTGAKPLATLTHTRAVPDAKYFMGSGKAQQLREQVRADQPDLVVFNHDLTPAQERNLERLIQCRVLDRTGLILDIFAQRARSHAGKLQVELAQLQHLSTRLVRGWTHLERQKGGIGLRGPGETQLETDRRLLRNRIKTIHKRLAKVTQQREQNRGNRLHAQVPTVALVGYTNAGKSSLFNQLTGETMYAADQLFATLDPTTRSLHVPGVGTTVLIDTVGFMSHLPHDLIESFKSTLEETCHADLLLHVVDLANPQWLEQIEQVNEVLHTIEALQIPQLLVYNKIDLIAGCQARLELNEEVTLPGKVWISAQQASGLDLLIQAIGKQLSIKPLKKQIQLQPHQGRLRAQLYQLGVVMNEWILEEGHWLLDLNIAEKDYQRLFPID